MDNQKLLLPVIAKVFLAIIIFATIFVGGVYLIGKQEKDILIYNTYYDPLMDRCAKAGEGSWSPSVGYRNRSNPGKCCEGLVEIYAGLKYYAAKDSCRSLGKSIYVCSDCGNSVCESWENRCNCPEDCEEQSDTFD